MKQPIQIRLHVEDGAFWATVDEYPGVFAAGDTLEELRESLEEGLSLVTEQPMTLAEFRARTVETIASGELVTA
jgi:predicted RNase H-like HicB family nuclease